MWSHTAQYTDIVQYGTTGKISVDLVQKLVRLLIEKFEIKGSNLVLLASKGEENWIFT